MPRVGAFGEYIQLDTFFVRDAAGVQHQMLGVICQSTLFHVCSRMTERFASHCFWLFNMIWLSWAGPPIRMVLDRVGSFFGHFKDKLEQLSVDIFFVLATSLGSIYSIMLLMSNRSARRKKWTS